MGVIVFSDEPDAIWKVGNWVHRRFLNDVAAFVTSDQQVADTMRGAIANCGLHLDLLDDATARRAIAALKQVAAATLANETFNGMTYREGLDENSLKLYGQAMAGLLEMLSRYTGSRGDGV